MNLIKIPLEKLKEAWNWLVNLLRSIGWGIQWLAERFVNHPIWGVIVVLVAGALFLFVFFVGSVSLLHYSESTEFCGSCHAVMDPWSITHRYSTHAHCGTCHIGPGVWAAVQAKLENVRYLWVYPLNLYPRPLPSPPTEQALTIPWVQAVIDGKRVEYIDVASDLTAAEIEAAEKQRMDCMDCHNRATHVIDRPANVVDEAMARGELPDDLPYFLLPAIQAYAETTAGTPLAYDPATYPYWFTDTNGNGEVDEDETGNDNRYMSWTPSLLRAAYNYQYVANDPGAFAHNNPYILQVLYDCLEAIGGQDAVAGMSRPE